MTVRVHNSDLPDLSAYGDSVAVDTETMGLKPHRDRLCLVQLSPGDGSADLVRIDPGQGAAPNLTQLLTDPARTKLFHFARFDIAVLEHAFGIEISPVWCTKIASKLARTNTDRHSLKDLTRDLLGVDISKEQQSSDWGANELSANQIRYAAADVLYLHDLVAELSARLDREGRMGFAHACFKFLPTRARLDLAGWEDMDIFAH